MKTIKMTRTIRRVVPNGWLAWIGPDGIHLRTKRTTAVFHLTWKEIIDRRSYCRCEAAKRPTQRESEILTSSFVGTRPKTSRQIF